MVSFTGQIGLVTRNRDSFACGSVGVWVQKANCAKQMSKAYIKNKMYVNKTKYRL